MKKMTKRVERDSIGEVSIDCKRLWGAQTQRSLTNFRIGEERMPSSIVRAIILIKKATAVANGQLGVLGTDEVKSIESACERLLTGEFDAEFPLLVWQTGSGTQTNMNVNEVIAHMTDLHPNDCINKSQSSNDVFPSAMHIAVYQGISDKLFPAMDRLEQTFSLLAKNYDKLIKIGRTHLQDATPLSLGQEISAWAAMLSEAKSQIMSNISKLRKLALGGTAVGTGIGAPLGFDKVVCSKLSDLTGIDFSPQSNKFYALTSKASLAAVHGCLKALACDLLKIANDIRLLSSGPRCGIGELVLPANEPGSSIMPGKVNPTQCEALSMVCVQVMGNDVTIGIAASQGNFELNVYMPVIAYNALQSIGLLADAINSFNDNCAIGISPNEKQIATHLQNSLMLVTYLSPSLGYDTAAKIAKMAYEEGISLREAVVKSGKMTGEDFDKILAEVSHM